MTRRPIRPTTIAFFDEPPPEHVALVARLLPGDPVASATSARMALEIALTRAALVRETTWETDAQAIQTLNRLRQQLLDVGQFLDAQGPSLALTAVNNQLGLASRLREISTALASLTMAVLRAQRDLEEGTGKRGPRGAPPDHTALVRDLAEVWFTATAKPPGMGGATDGARKGPFRRFLAAVAQCADQQIAEASVEKGLVDWRSAHPGLVG